MSRWTVWVSGVIALCGILPSQKNLLAAREGFSTKLTARQRDDDELQDPKSSLFDLVEFPTGIGKMKAYLGKRPVGPAKKKHPAILWLVGGMPVGGASDSAWRPRPRANDQSAKQFREAGLVMMYPTLRGSFGNPGVQEGFYGEVDDVLAALQFLRKVDYVDPERIYLGGHSSGGTLALLVAAATDQLRAVVAYGPVADISDYGADDLPFDLDRAREVALRSPGEFLDAIRVPTFVIEGAKSANAVDLRTIRKSRNDRLHVAEISGGNHFDILAPLNAFLAGRMVRCAADAELGVTAAELDLAFQMPAAIPVLIDRESASMADRVVAVRKRIADYAAAKRLAIQLAVVHGDTVPFAGVIGKARDPEVKVGAKTLFPLGGLSRVFTDTALARMLRADGLKEVRMAAALGGMAPDGAEGLTLRSLWRRPRKIERYRNYLMSDDLEEWTFDAVLMHRCKDYPVSPGRDLDYALLQRGVEHASGVSWTAALRRHFAKPIGLAGGAYEPEAVLAAQDRVPTYAPAKFAASLFGTLLEERVLSDLPAADGVWLAAGDLGRWLQELRRVVTSAEEGHPVVRHFTQWSSSRFSGTARSAARLGPGAVSEVVIYPEQEVAIAVVINERDQGVGIPFGLQRDIELLLLPPRPPKSSAGGAFDSRYSGRKRWQPKRHPHAGTWRGHLHLRGERLAVECVIDSFAVRFLRVGDGPKTAVRSAGFHANRLYGAALLSEFRDRLRIPGRISLTANGAALVGSLVLEHRSCAMTLPLRLRRAN